MSNFKKQSLAFVLLLSLLQFTPVSAATKSPAGQICKKKSAATTFAKQTYICKSVGKKLLWTLQVKKVVPPVLSWAEIAAKAAADQAIIDAQVAADKAVAEAKAIADAKAIAEKEAADKAAILAAQKPSIAGLQIGNLLWSEDFLGTASEKINPKNWSARNCHRVPVSDGGGACFGVESQFYAPSAITLDGSKDGAAVITTTRVDQTNKPADAGTCLGDFGCKFVSGRFDTHNKVSFKYGYIEARIKMPSGSGNHPAFWMLGDNINQVGWPTTGEMDITEIHSNIPNETTAAINYSTSGIPNDWRAHNYVVEKLNLGSDVSQGYHLYALAWLPDSISYYADNKLVFQVSRTVFEAKYGYWSFDKSFFVILNNAVSEGFSGSSANLQSSTMSIDWVRSYQVNGLGQVTIK